MDGLIIKSPWIDLILTGKKTWEIRGTNTDKRGVIGLIESGTKHIVGIAKIVNVHGPLTLIDFKLHRDKHLSTPEELESLPYTETYAWELADAEPLFAPIPYDHPAGAIVWINLDKIGIDYLTSSRKIYKIPNQALKDSLIKSIEEDLRYLNHGFEYNNGNDNEYKEITISSKYHNYSSREDLADKYLKLRNRLLLSNKPFITKMEEKANILEYFADGDEVEIPKIKPEIQECITQKGKDIFKYCGYLESIPNTGGIGRRITSIVWDKGQDRDFIMGIIGLSSAGYSLKCRDDYLGWNQKNIDSYSAFKKLKDDGLKNVMQLSTCMAVPPYTYLHSAKLMAILSLSNSIQKIFNKKYKSNLLAVIATGIYGEHSAIYNRISLKKLYDKKEYPKLELYEKIGNTSEYSSLILSEKTKELAKNVLKNTDAFSPSFKHKNPNFSTSNELIRALKICGLNKEILELNRKVVYVGSLNKKNLEILRGNQESPLTELNDELAINYWQKELIPKISSKTEKLEIFKQFKKNQLSIIEQLRLTF